MRIPRSSRALPPPNQDGLSAEFQIPSAASGSLAPSEGERAGVRGFPSTIHDEAAEEFASLTTASDPAGNLAFRTIVLPGEPPLYARNLPSDGAHSVAYQFLDQTTGSKLLVAPDVSGVNDGLRAALADSDAVLFDGTFWSPDELRQVRPGARLANEMGHLTIGGVSLNLLRGSPARHKIYLHINNTNPILAADSPERRAVEDAGIVVGYDGLEFKL